MKDHTVKPYPFCKGLKWRRRRYWRKHRRPLVIKYVNKICNMHFTEKNKIRFVQQFFRWFIKAPEGFKIAAYLKEPYTFKDLIYKLNECDIINISCRTYKAAWKNLLIKLNYKMIDYKPLRQRRKYCLYFTFFFSNVTLKNKQIMLDIICTQHNCYRIFIILDGTFFDSFKHIFENIRIWKI